MDARVDSRPITARHGKPVEVNALWIDGLTAAAAIARSTGRDPTLFERLAAQARPSFAARFPRPDGHGLFDIVDGPDGDDSTVRPNQLLAASLDLGPGADPAPILTADAPLVTSIGMRSLAPDHVDYSGLRRGDPATRDAAYHQGTIWPWLIGSYVDTLVRTGRPLADLEPLAGLEVHLADRGVGSVSETADGDTPHNATGCPFQAWSVAELLRARRGLRSVR
jgi:predicted glycogen debranching enzyme